MSLTKVSYSMITGAPVNVFDYMTAAQIADVLANTYNENVTLAVQAALDSGADSIYFPAGTYKISTLTVPSTVREIKGVSAHRGFGTRLRFDTGQTLTNGFLVSVGCSGLAVSNLSLEFRSGSYTNGIYIDNDNHYQTWTNVTTDDSASPGGFRVANHWYIDNNCWSNVFIHCGAWGQDQSATIALYLTNSANAMDFYSCRWLHCGIGVYLPGASMELQNFYGGEIASNAICGVHIGNTAGTASAQLESLNFYGVYFEDQPIHIIQNMPDMKGLNCIGCRTSETAWSSFIKLEKSTYTVKIIGGSFIRQSGGTGYLLDVNNQLVVNATIDNPVLISSAAYTNAGNQQVWFRTNQIGGSPGQISYETKGLEAQEDYNTAGSFAGKIIKRYLSNGVNKSLQEKNQSVVWDAQVPSSLGSLWVTTTFQRGDICWNNEPSGGNTPGWVCVTAGTPGTWKAMANLSA